MKCRSVLSCLVSIFSICNSSRTGTKPLLRLAAAQLQQQKEIQAERRGGRLRGQRSRADSLQAVNQSDPFSLDFFSEDADRMAAMPAYDTVAHEKRAAKITGPSARLCDPRCNWKCGPHIECNQVCEPACAPPKCHTLCSRRAENCETRCGPPRCAVVCPHSDAESECVDGKCAGCKTVCSPPLCTTQCGDDCQNVCEQPVCLWKCRKPEVCPQPKCDLHCSGFARCAVASNLPHSVPLSEKMDDPDAHVYSQGSASLDPMSVYAPAAAPPPWPLAEVKSSSPIRVEAFTKGARNMREPSNSQNKQQSTTSLGPVSALKMKWAAEDAQDTTR